MNKLDELDFEEKAASEITLGVTSLLGIFFAAVLVCGVFFGFGYTVGRSSMQKVIAANNNDSNSSAGFGSFKPSPVSPAIQNVPSDTSTANAGNPANEADALSTPAAEPELHAQPSGDPTPASADTTANANAGTIAATVPAVKAPSFSKPERTTPAATPVAFAQTSTPPPPAADGQNAPIMVQIAAVSHQEDANVLLSALRKRGYNVVAKPDLLDNLIHVQVGPFASRKDANLMRQKLLSDGYNAIVK